MSEAPVAYTTTVRAALCRLSELGPYWVEYGYLPYRPELLLVELAQSPECDAPAELELPNAPMTVGRLYVAGTPVFTAQGTSDAPIAWVGVDTWPTTLDVRLPQVWDIAEDGGW